MNARPAAQVAAEAGCTVHHARLALLLAARADLGATLGGAAAAIGCSRLTAQRVARAWMIEFADYRPYAHRDPRPVPRGRLTRAPNSERR